MVGFGFEGITLAALGDAEVARLQPFFCRSSLPLRLSLITSLISNRRFQNPTKYLQGCWIVLVTV
jgi:hypothetical protein